MSMRELLEDRTKEQLVDIAITATNLMLTEVKPAHVPTMLECNNYYELLMPSIKAVSEEASKAKREYALFMLDLIKEQYPDAEISEEEYLDLCHVECEEPKDDVQS